MITQRTGSPAPMLERRSASMGSRTVLPPPVEVAVAVVRAGDGRCLLAERRPHQVAAGQWEFPGGKMERGETAAAAVVRELAEEIGITPVSLRPGPVHEHAFPTRRVRLNYFFVDAWTGAPHGREGQQVAWVDPRDRSFGPLLPSNHRMIDMLALSDTCLVIDAARGQDANALLDAFRAALADGRRLFQLRAAALAPSQRVALGRRIATLADGAGATVLLVGTALEAQRAGLAGVHTAAADLGRIIARPETRLWSVSVHDEAGLRRAEALGADFVLLSPVLPTASHPDSPALGWAGLQRLAAAARIPLYAQGGMSAATLADARRAGSAGIAMALPIAGTTTRRPG